MTTPNREYPKGALTGVAGSSARALQSVTQQDAINSLRAPVDESFSWFRSGVRSMLAGVVNFFGSALLGSWNTVRPEDIVVNDGQIQLNGRNDLLEGVRGYASAYQTLNVRTASGYVFAGGQKWRFLPFGGQLGPAKGATIDPSGGIVLNETGLWTVYTTVTKNSSGSLDALLPDQLDLHLFVSRNKWTKNEEPPESNLLRSLRATDMTIIGGKQTASIVFSVVVDQPGVFVGVRAAATSDTWFLGGTLYSNLFVVKHDNRVQNPGQQTVPDEA